jgi:HSP20 family protein
MAVSRYTPSTDLFRPFLDESFVPFARMGSSMRVPDTDVVERENEIKVICELPGMEKNEVELSLENNVLTISGEKREERTQGDEGDTYHLSERRWGRFSRSFVLPREVDQDRIHATFQDGVLTVCIPKDESVRRRRIEIGDSANGPSRGEEARQQGQQQ